jgi:hypothetical protein
MDGKSRYQVKILSKQINKINYYCSNSNSNSTVALTPLDPYFITGLADAEASVIILILTEPRNITN